MNKPYFSVVIPAFNEEILLPHLLLCLKKQTYRDFETIVADYDSTDDTPNIIKKFGVKSVRGGNRPGISRNFGAEVATGEYIVFLDSDTTVGVGFLEKLSKQIEKRGFVAASGFFRGDKGSAFDRFTHQFLNYYFWSLQKIDPHACGFYFVIKRDVFEKLGGFDPKIIMAEDHDLALRVSKIGKFTYLRKPTVTVSTRRVKREGFFTTVAKGLYVEIYRIFRKKITKKLFNYQMGGGNEEIQK